MSVVHEPGGNPLRTLGPITDLERHLPAEWWRGLFNSSYLKTDGDVVENMANTDHDVELLMNQLHMKPEHRVLDLCCGQGRHSIALAEHGLRHVTGLDRSRYLIRLARKRARRAGLSITFKEGDARKLRLPEGHFDFVVCLGNSFGYFERAEDDLSVLSGVFRVLEPGGYLAMDIVRGDWMRDNFEKRSWEWIDQSHFVCRERVLSESGDRLISREVITHAERGVIADQFYAERLYTFSSIRALLEEAGFNEVRLASQPVTESDRGQDLGMMARRMLIVARKPVSVFVTRHPSPALQVKEITVVMGDPSLPDDVKREGKFNPEDFETIEKMKRALGEIAQFKYRFLNRHDGLIEELRENPPQLVLNLCDEGFGNDAFKELHVPALLEMIGVPYTGAGPACLAMCYDKATVRSVAQSLEIPVPLETYYGAEDQSATLPSVFPALLKPNFGDSSLGITMDAVVNDMEGLVAYWEALRVEFPDRPLLVQEFLTGTEYSVGVIGNPGVNLTVLPILEVDYSGLPEGLPKILGYESKWLPDSPYWTQIKHKEAEVDAETGRRLVDYSLHLFERLRCRDYARFDFRADAQGRVKLLEVNPNPGWCWDGKMNIMAGFAGMSYRELLQGIIDAAMDRLSLDATLASIARGA